jgi:transposase
LTAAAESVVDVPPKLSARVRVLSSFAGNARKNDGLDALATALAASGNERLASVDPEAASEVLRLLSESREDLVVERTRALNRLHGLLRDLVPGGIAGTLSADRAARILRGIRPQGSSSRVRRRLASEVLRDVRTLDRKIADLGGRIESEVEASGTSLTEIFGIGPILAATIIGTVGDVARFPSKAHFASYSGTAPVEASSGEVVRHRLSLADNRKPPLRAAHGRGMPSQVGCSGWYLLPQEDGGGQVPQGGATVPQAASLRRRVQELRSGLRGAF